MSTQATLSSSADVPSSVVVRNLATSYALSQAVYVVAKLGIADLLADGPKDRATLAAATETHAPSLYRVLRLLTTVGVFAEREDGLFELTPAGDCLRTAPGSMRLPVTVWGSEWVYRPFGDLLYSVKTGAPAFDHIYGMGFFPYLAQNPEAGRNFNEGLTDLFLQQRAAVAKAYDFSGFHKIVDVGGGYGALVTTILKGNPHLHGVLFDQPSVVEGGKNQIEAAGVADRCEAVAGNFFEAVPPGGDLYCLSLVIHDWDDDRSLTILKNCHRAMEKGGKLLLVEVLVGVRNEPDWGKLTDAYMLVLTRGGRERTVAEYGDLFAAAGFRLTTTIATQSEMSIIEGVRV